MPTFLQDLQYAARVLWKRPGFALIAVVTLALGIGANTAIFSVMHGIVLEPLPHPEPEQLITVWENFEARGGPRTEWTGRSTFVDWREQNRVFENLAAYSGWSPTLTGAAAAERLAGEAVTVDYFSVLGARPAAGRFFAAEEEVPGDTVVVLGDDLWQRRFGGDPGVVGKTVTLDGAPVTVIGVLPAGFQSPFNPGAEIWRVLTIPPGFDDRGSYYLRTVGRVREGVDLAAARADMTRVAGLVAEAHPEEYKDVGVTLVPLHDSIVGPGRPALMALMGAVALVLLIACANIANLLLARSAAREQEMAIRASLGAGRVRIVRQLLTESLMLAALGGALGLLLGSWGITLLKSIAPAQTPRLDQVGLHPEVLLFALAAALATGVLFGLAPALKAARTSFSSALQQGGRQAGEVRGGLRQGLVVAEVAVALTLLVGGGLLIKSFWQLTQEDPGIEPAGLMSANLNLPRARYDSPEKIAAFYDQLDERLVRHPSLAAAGMTSSLPMAPGGDQDVTVTIEGQPSLAFADRATGWYRQVTAGYLDTMGIGVLRGRGFEERDRIDSLPVALVNETFARRFFAAEDPVGQRMKLGGPESERPWRTIVGIVGDVRYRGLGTATIAEFYVPQGQFPSRAMAVVLKARAGGEPLDVLRAEAAALDPDIAVFNPAPMEALVAASIALPRFTTTLWLTFAALALILAAIGIYGVLTWTVSRRVREIGVRMALGAERRDVVGLVVSQGLRWTAAGVAVGLATSLWVTRLLERLLFEVRPTDPATFAATAALLLAVAFMACYLPARRAARVDPLVSLRHQ